VKTLLVAAIFTIWAYKSVRIVENTSQIVMSTVNSGGSIGDAINPVARFRTYFSSPQSENMAMNSSG